MEKFVFFAPSPTSPNRSTVAYSFARGTAGVADPLLAIDGVRAEFLCLSSKPCHGAMLFSDTRSGTYRVCNPSTGECIPLPKHSRSLQESSAGLVYDDRTRERKVVHLFLNNDTGIGCEIYTLCDPSRRWRPAKEDLRLVGPENMIKLGEALLTEDLVTKAPPVFANGCLHWLAYSSRSDQAGRDAVLCFSVATEMFRVLNAPASLHVAEYMELDENLPAVPLHLAELEGSLAMVHDLRRRGQGRSWMDVWMLKDHAASEWSLDYRIDVTPLLSRHVHYSPRFITVLGCSGGGGGVGNKQDNKKILIATSQHQVHAYDPDTREVQLVLSIPETAIRIRPKEAPAALWLGLYEDSLSRIGCESHQEKQVLSALTKILVRLPVKSIVQSMLVCRQWCSLIESESFASEQMSLKRPMRILMANNGCGRRAFFDFVPVKDWLQAAAGPGLADTLANDKIISSKPCHGLNLISTTNDDFICNISTGVIRCLGRRGKSHLSSHGNPSGHAFSVGRSVGFGFDPSTGEHVVVEIGHIRGTLACMIKTMSDRHWSCIGKPPRPVTSMPSAHVDGALYWMSQPAHDGRVVVTLDISTRVFSILTCEPCSNNDDDRGAFLVELNGRLSLVGLDARAEKMDIWFRQKHAHGHGFTHTRYNSASSPTTLSRWVRW
jgi:F-box interacting protein